MALPRLSSFLQAPPPPTDFGGPPLPMGAPPGMGGMGGMGGPPMPMGPPPGY